MRPRQLLFTGLLASTLLGTGTLLSVETPTTAQASTLKTFPKKMRGTWYYYNHQNHHYYKTRITAKAMIFDGYKETLHSRKSLFYHGNPKNRQKYARWITAEHVYTTDDDDFIHTYGWYQGAGSGEFYQRTNNQLGGKLRPALQYCHGAGIITQGYAYRTKALAKRYARARFAEDVYASSY